MNKQESEFAIFSTVYDSSAFEETLSSDKPDIRSHRVGKPWFGVEIAEAQGEPIAAALDNRGWLAAAHGWGIRASQRGVQFADYADQSPPLQQSIPELEALDFPIAEFADFESMFRSDRSLECEMAMDARVVPELP